MNTLQEWRDYYRKMKVWIIPYNIEEYPWKYWKDKKDGDYLKLCESWSWGNAIGLKLIVGKKGIRVIELHDEELLTQALALLKLPEDYLWVIDSTQGLGIVIDTPNVSKSVFGMTNRGYEKLTVIWEGYYVLPTIGIPRYFYKNRMPSDHPIQITDDDFIKCIEVFKI